jgi:MinD-like ATPase involved in chromosome partitioning or flagellar assembly
MGAKIISIHSYRGGTGKSNTTANLACQMAMAGKRVAMVDTDIQSPGIHVLFGLDEHSMGHTLNEFLHGECSIEDAAYSVADHADNSAGRGKLKGKALWLLPASPNREQISEILEKGYDVNLLNKGLQTLHRKLELDYLFIDTHPGLNDETLLSIAISDSLIIILRPDNQDFQGTAVTVDVARSLDVQNLFLLVNKALIRYDFNQIKKQVEDTYKAPVLTVLPLTEDVVDNASSDVYSLRDPNHDWSKSIKGAAETLMTLLEKKS